MRGRSSSAGLGPARWTGLNLVPQSGRVRESAGSTVSSRATKVDDLTELTWKPRILRLAPFVARARASPVRLGRHLLRCSLHFQAQRRKT